MKHDYEVQQYVWYDNSIGNLLMFTKMSAKILLLIS